MPRIYIFTSIVIALLACHMLLTLSAACAEVKRIKSVKSLTHLLSNVEKQNSDKASFITMKLQIYLEDVFISQGTTVYLKPGSLSHAIKQMMDSGRSKEDISMSLVKMYQDGDFHD